MIDNLLYKENLKLYEMDIREIDSVVLRVRIFKEDVGMEVGIEKWAWVVIKI